MQIKKTVYEVLNLARDTEISLGEKGREEVYDSRVVDIAAKADRVISEKVLGYFKESGLPVIFLDEEVGRHQLSDNPEYTIAFDDIDGTFNNVRGRGILPATSIVTIFDSPNPRFSDALAAGVIDIRTGSIWYAERGKGVEFNGVRTKTIGKEEIDAKTFIAIDSTLTDPSRFRRLYEKAWVKDYGTAGLQFAGLVGGGPNNTGIFDAILHSNNKTHELGAGFLLVKEGGGWIADFDGKPFDDRIYDFDAKYPVVAAATETLGRGILRLISV